MQSRAINPVEGLPTIEVINLIEMSADYRLDADMRYKAIVVVEDHLAENSEPTVRGVLHALLAHKEFEGFVSVAAQSMLPGVTGWQSGQIK
jgi:hypothetical protein